MNRFPYTNFHDINLDWIVKQIKDFASSLNALAQRLATFVSLPAGGSTGEALVKKSNANYDVEWDTIQAGVISVDGKTGNVTVLPVAGATGQALVKRSAANYDVEWDTISGGASVYYAEYGVDDVSDIYTEYSANKIVLCEYNGNIYSLFNCSSTLAHFSYINENVSRVLEVVGSTWTYTTKTLAIESDVHDIPQGGTAGQALTKVDGTDYNVEWSTISGSGAVDSVDGKTGNVTVLPTGGTADQVLAKVDGTNYNVYWKTVSGGGTTDVYWCTYGTTTNAEIETAINDGKLVACTYNTVTYILTVRSGNNSHRFSAFSEDDTVKFLLCYNNNWSNSLNNFIHSSGSISGEFLKYVSGAWYTAPIHQIPAGGTAGQALTKVNGTDYNVQWSNAAGGFSPTLLWTNPSPSNSFSAQVISTITGLTNHTWFMVKYRNFAVNDAQYGMLYAICSASSTTYDMLEFESATNNRNGYRKIRIDTRSGYEEVTFTACTYNDSTNNNYAVPIEIYGL